MMTPAFSVVACPELTLDQIAPLCRKWGFLAVELRTFGEGSRGIASDPALIAPEKVRRLMTEAGVRVCSLATSVSFDAPVRPPVIGHAIGDTELPVRAAKAAIDIAISIECPLVRVFGFEVRYGEPRASVIARMVQRLSRVVDHAHRTGVRVTLENGGSFNTAAELIEVINRVNSPLLGASYNVAAAQAAGEAPDAGVRLLGERLLTLRVKDLRDGRPTTLGEGTTDWRGAIAAAAALKADVPVVFEWDRAWMPELKSAGEVMPAAARTLLSEVSRHSAVGPSSRVPADSAA